MTTAYESALALLRQTLEKDIGATTFLDTAQNAYCIAEIAHLFGRSSAEVREALQRHFDQQPRA